MARKKCHRQLTFHTVAVMRPFGLCLGRYVWLASLLVMVGCGSEPKQINTTVLNGEQGKVYFNCWGYVTSTHLWLSADSAQEQGDSDFWTGGGRWEGFSKLSGDTLLIYADWRFNEPTVSALPYELAYRDIREAFGVPFHEVHADPQSFGVENVSC